MRHPALPRPAPGTSAAQEGPAFMGLWCSSRSLAKGLLDVLLSPAALVHPQPGDLPDTAMLHPVEKGASIFLLILLSSPIRY